MARDAVRCSVCRNGAALLPAAHRSTFTHTCVPSLTTSTAPCSSVRYIGMSPSHSNTSSHGWPKRLPPQADDDHLGVDRTQKRRRARSAAPVVSQLGIRHSRQIETPPRWTPIPKLMSSFGLYWVMRFRLNWSTCFHPNWSTRFRPSWSMAVYCFR
jgi:hypothetical protein